MCKDKPQSDLQIAQTPSREELGMPVYFKVKVDDIVSEISPALKIKKAGIQLRFFRYGLFHENADRVTINPDGSISDDLPDVENFKYVKTTLNKGFVYILDDKNPDLWYEYETFGEGRLRSVIWDENKDDNGQWSDVRTSSLNYDTFAHLTFKEESALWIAFSPVQWSVDYHNRIRTDEKLREKRMIKVECNGFEQSQETVPNIVPYDEMTATFDTKDIGQQTLFKNTIEDLGCDNKEAMEEDEAATKDDLFITLHDPLGCAIDLYEHLALKNIEHKALVDSIQTGEPFEQAKARLASGQIQSDYNDPDYSSLFNLANFCYRYIYSDKANIKQYSANIKPSDKSKFEGIDYLETGTFCTLSSNVARSVDVSVTDLGQDGADLEKIAAILGLEERRGSRKRVEEARDSLGDFLKTDYCQSHLSDFKENCEECKIEGHDLLMEILIELVANPMEAERVIQQQTKPEKGSDEKKDNDEENDFEGDDRWQDFVFKLVDGKEKKEGDLISDLLATEYNLELLKKNKKDLINKFWSIVRLEWELRKKRIIATKVSNGVTVTCIDQVTSILSEEINGRYFNRSQTKFRLDNNKLSLHLEECDLTMNMEKVKFKTRNAGNVGLLYLAESETKIRTVGGKTIIDLPTSREIELSGWQESVNKLNKAAARLLDSPSFNSFLGGLQLLCLQSAVEDLKLNSENRVKSYADIAAATAGLTEAAMRVHAGMIKNMGKEISEILYGRIRLAGAVAGYLTAGVCVWDGVNAFLERDKDAGVAFISAGMAFGISTTYSTVLAGAAMAGPIALLAAGAAFALLLAAHALTDREIQKFFKYFLLSNARSLPKKQGESPVQYGRRILQNQEYLMGRKPTDQALRQWMNPEHAHLSFYDMIVCTDVKFYDKKGPTSIRTFATGTSPGSSSFTHKYNIVKAELSFQMFFNVESGCKTLAYFFPNGVEDDEWEPAGSDFPWEFVPNDEQFPSLRIKIEIPDDKISRIKSGSELLLLVRIVNTGKDLPSFPLSWGDSRYLAARVELFDINDIRFDKDVKVKIDTRNNLLNPATWKE